MAVVLQVCSFKVRYTGEGRCYSCHENIRRDKSTGVPEAWVSWWQNNRLLSNGSQLIHHWESQLYKVTEFQSDAGVKVSELFIFDLRAEDSGVYYCRGNNAAGWARANFTITVVSSENEEEAIVIPTQRPEDTRQMFQVEYILGFGAAVVIILTIIIVLVLYLVLQCRQRRRDRHLRKLICDSHSSGSFTERSTVDYIVPGEMELISAVRSVSCNSSMSKCKQGDDEEYGPGLDNPPIIDSLFVKNKQPDCPPPPPPPTGLSCSNPDLVQDTKLWDRGGGNAEVYRPAANGSAGQQGGGYPQGVPNYPPQGSSPYPQGGNYAPHQYFPPGPAFYAQNVVGGPHVRLQYLAGGSGGPIYPPFHHTYRGHAPFHIVQHKQEGGETLLSANGLTVYPRAGENIMWQPHLQFYQYPAEQQQQPQPQPQQHTKDCPRSRNHSGFAQVHHPSNGETYLMDRPPQTSNGYHPGSRGVYPQTYFQQPPPYNPPPSVHQQWSLEDEDMKYGPFSDGEAETLKRPHRQVRKSVHARSQHPHYATMSRGDGLHYAPNSDRRGVRYTSHPQLHGALDYLDKDSADSGMLSPFSMKTSITFPRQKPGQLQEKGGNSSVNSNNISDGVDGGYPDLARHPLSYSSAPPTSGPMNYNGTSSNYNGAIPSFNGNIPSLGIPVKVNGTPSLPRHYPPPLHTSDSLDSNNEYQNSRSSSVGEINWRGSSAPRRPDQHQLYQNGGGGGGEEWTNGWTADWIGGQLGQMDSDQMVKMAINGIRRRSRVGAAVKVDLSCADKTIRRPESAPDLASADEQADMSNGGGRGSSLKKRRPSKEGRSVLLSRDRSNSSDRSPAKSRSNSTDRKPGVSPATRKQVVFAGIDDTSSTSSDDKGSMTSEEDDAEDVWVKRPHQVKEEVPVTGVVIAQPPAAAAICTYYATAPTTK